jgi:hypothetical protein
MMESDGSAFVNILGGELHLEVLVPMKTDQSRRPKPKNR